MKKILLGFIVIYIIIIGILTFIWSEKDVMTNEKYNELKVYYMSEKDCTSYTHLQDYIVQDEAVTDISDLKENSELVIKAKMTERKFVGEGVINICDVIQLYKGEYKENKIMIYDFTYSWGSTTGYFEGAVPLHEGDTYIMFLNSAPNPNVKDTYIFSSFSYGHFRIKEDALSNSKYDLNDPMSVQQVSRYDHVCFDNRKTETFQMLQKQIFHEYNNK